MKLYYSPGACSLSPHIVLAEAGLAYSIEKVDLKTKKTETGTDFFAVNPAGYVPALVLDNGEVLTEGPAIVQYLADQAPERKLAPPPASFERVRLQEMLNFISTEVHKSFSPLFNPASSEETKAAARALIGRRLDVIEQKLAGRDYLLGDFSVADAYLFTVTSWGRMVGVDIKEGRPRLGEYWSRVKARPGVHQAMQEEGLIK
ncbi:MAG: glutathione transferase GstA [Rhodocyclales bacterium]|nr:glutathione transferase GstA [Rhodocyclales bacterium]